MKQTFMKIAIIALGAVMMASCTSQEKKTESTAIAQDSTVEAKEVIAKEISPDVKAMQTAFELAKYGYEVSSASALIEAANILASIPSQDLKLEATNGAESENTTEKTSNVEYTPTKLLASAKEMAMDDATLTAMIAKVEAKLSAATEGTRGAMGGPRGAYGKVYANSYTYYDQKFWANEVAEVAVSGDGDTDLDLYVYDENGHLIVSDTDYTDDCYVRWVPSWTGLFRIKIVNRGGVYNNYAIATN